MRERQKILGSLESLYREAFEGAERRADDDAMAELDFGFRRDQIWLEVLLDLRDQLTLGSGEEGEEATSLLEQAKALRDMTRGKLR